MDVCFHCFGCMSRDEIAGPNPLIKHSKNCQTVATISTPFLTPSNDVVRFHFSTSLAALPVFLLTEAILVGVRRYVMVVLIFIS